LIGASPRRRFGGLEAISELDHFRVVVNLIGTDPDWVDLRALSEGVADLLQRLRALEESERDCFSRLRVAEVKTGDEPRSALASSRLVLLIRCGPARLDS
jgi:hypothetical protein